MDKIYKLTCTKREIEEYKNIILNGKGDYIAGLLIGKLEQNSKFISSMSEPLKKEDLIKPL